MQMINFFSTIPLGFITVKLSVVQFLLSNFSLKHGHWSFHIPVRLWQRSSKFDILLSIWHIGLLLNLSQKHNLILFCLSMPSFWLMSEVFYRQLFCRKLVISRERMTFTRMEMKVYRHILRRNVNIYGWRNNFGDRKNTKVIVMR